MDNKKCAVIAGGGPAGLTCGIYLARAGWNVSLFTNEEETISCLAEAPWVENFPGFPKGIKGADLLELMTKQAIENDIKIYGEGIVQVNAEKKIAYDSNNSMIKFDAFVMATGTTPREFKFNAHPENAHIPIHTCAVCDGGLYSKDDTLIVIGAGDTAFADAYYLAGKVKEVYLIARRDKFRATNLKTVQNFKNLDNTHILVNSVVTDIHDLGNREYNAVINNGEQEIKVNGFFSCIGYDENFIPVSSDSTNCIVFCGDCCAGAERQAIIAAASGAEAALDIIYRL